MAARKDKNQTGSYDYKTSAQETHKPNLNPEQLQRKSRKKFSRPNSSTDNTTDRDKYSSKNKKQNDHNSNQNTHEITACDFEDSKIIKNATDPHKSRKATENTESNYENGLTKTKTTVSDTSTNSIRQSFTTNTTEEIKSTKEKWRNPKKLNYSKNQYHESSFIIKGKTPRGLQKQSSNREKPYDNITNLYSQRKWNQDYATTQNHYSHLNLTPNNIASRKENPTSFIFESNNNCEDLQFKPMKPTSTHIPLQEQTENTPKQKGVESKSWKMEIYKISTLYYDSFKLIKQDDSEVIFQLTHYPSDPDFDITVIPNGFLWEIRVFPEYFDNSLQISSEKIEEAAILTKNEGLSDFYGVCISQLFSHNIKNSLIKTNRIYESLKLLDKQLNQIQIQIKLFESEQAKKKEMATEWSNDEQSRLEEALVWYRRVKDPQQKWELISKYLKSRTEKECIERFKYCREIASQEVSIMQQVPKIHQAPIIQHVQDELNGELLSTLQEKGQDSSMLNSREVTYSENKIKELPKGPHIITEKLDLLNISTICIVTIKFQYFCKDCMKLSAMSISTESKKLGLEIYASGKYCEKCNKHIVARYQPKFAFVGSDLAGRLNSDDCEIIDIIGADLIAICSECSHEYNLNGFQNGSIKSFNCHECYAKLSLSIENFLLQLDYTNQTICELTNEIQNLKLVQNGSPKKPKDRPIRLNLKRGQPLPNNGACKHYKKSFRWLRFPCCGMAYPCDICHDTASDHPHDWANRMICGFCSLEQHYSQKPCICGESLTADRSAHWEGGRGNRNKITMNRKDKHKYKNLTKNQSTGSKK